jgi:endonuclease III
MPSNTARQQQERIMSNLIKTIISVSDLRQGMTVEIDGNLKTVSLNKIKQNYIYDGQRYKDGITRVQFVVPTAFGVRVE